MKRGQDSSFAGIICPTACSQNASVFHALGILHSMQFIAVPLSAINELFDLLLCCCSTVYEAELRQHAFKCPSHLFQIRNQVAADRPYSMQQVYLRHNGDTDSLTVEVCTPASSRQLFNSTGTCRHSHTASQVQMLVDKKMHCICLQVTINQRREQSRALHPHNSMCKLRGRRCFWLSYTALSKLTNRRAWLFGTPGDRCPSVT